MFSAPVLLRRARLVTCLFTATMACLTPRPARAQGFADAVSVLDRAAFVERVKQHLLDDQEAESAYTYAERSREFRTERGQRRVNVERVFEVYPELDGNGIYRRLVATDGKPTPSHELEKRDRKRRQEVERALLKRSRESPEQRAQRLAREKKARAEQRAKLDEAFRLLEFRLAERTTLAGHPVLVADFRPRAGAVATSREGKVLQKFRGRAFVSEADAQVVRVELEALDTISFGFGVLARINKGSRAAFERRYVNGEVWLPASFRLRASGRQFLVKGIDVDSEVEWYDYRKFTVDTNESIAPPR